MNALWLSGCNTGSTRVFLMPENHKHGVYLSVKARRIMHDQTHRITVRVGYMELRL